MSELSNDELQDLLGLAHVVVTWTGQDTLRRDAAGYPHLVEARQAYLKARIEAFARIRPLLSTRDTGGCTCGGREVKATCMYHYGASLQPWNHRIPWNCPSFYDGCNCEGGPFYSKPAGEPGREVR